nr:hypothetical protein [Tanacetum cinerariifolium]
DPMRQTSKGPIIVDQHCGISNFREFASMQGGLSAFRTQANNSFFKGVPSYGQNMGTPNWQTPMLSHPGTSNYQIQMPSRSHPDDATPYWQPPMHSGNTNLQTFILSHSDDVRFLNPNILNRERREHRPNIYKRTPYMDLPPTTVLPKKHGDRNKNKVKNTNLSPLNLGNSFANDNVGDDDAMFLGGQFTGNYLVCDNVDPSKVIYMNSWIELLIRNRPQNALWTVSKPGTFSVHPESQRFMILTDQHIIGTLDGSTRPYQA